MLVCNCTAKECCIRVINFCIHHQASCFISGIILNMALLLRVVNESEHVVVNQVEEEVNPSVEVGFDNCGTSPESDFFVNQGKPRMHLNLPCVLQIYIAFAFIYCLAMLRPIKSSDDLSPVRFKWIFDYVWLLMLS